MDKVKTCVAQSTVWFLVFAWLAFSDTAWAYIDPASGGLILQAILGALAAVFVTLKLYWNKISSKLKKIFSDKSSDSQSDN